MSEDKLTKEDLVLLMESYRNMITLHQTVLNQTTKALEKLNIIDSKQDNLKDKNGNLCIYLTKIIETLDNQNTMGNNVSFKVDRHEKKSLEDHNKLMNRIHIGWIGMGTIVLSILGLIITLINTFHSTPNTPIH